LAGLEADFMQRLRAGVQRCVSGGKVGCFLSGGTDSSTVAGLLAELSAEPARTYSIGFDVEGYDELHFAQIATEHFGTQHKEYYLTADDVCATAPRLAATAQAPVGNESALAAYACARLARSDGVEVMLGGDGGDELFAGNERYAVQKVFEIYSAVPSMLRKLLLEPLFLGMPLTGRVPLLRKVRSYISQAKVSMPQRTETYNYVERFGTAELFEPEFLSGVDPSEPTSLLVQAYHGAKADGMLNRFLAMDMRFTLTDNDLPKVGLGCEMAEVAVDYPLLSDELVEFAARLPCNLKMKGLKLRWFWKHALRDFLPRAVLTKKKHGMGVPVGKWMEDHVPLRELVHDALSGLKSRAIVRAEFIDDLMRLHRTSHPAYYGVFLWVMVQMELWLSAHANPASDALRMQPDAAKLEPLQ
jgi:asparagine synthase (glutamine-hydrolysing)